MQAVVAIAAAISARRPKRAGSVSVSRMYVIASRLECSSLCQGSIESDRSREPFLLSQLCCSARPLQGLEIHTDRDAVCDFLETSLTLKSQCSHICRHKHNAPYFPQRGAGLAKNRTRLRARCVHPTPSVTVSDVGTIVLSTTLLRSRMRIYHTTSVILIACCGDPCVHTLTCFLGECG